MTDGKFSHLSSKYEDFMRKTPRIKDKCLEESITPSSSSFFDHFFCYLRVVKLSVNCFFVVFQFVSFLSKENSSVVQLTGSLTFENFSEIC